MADRTDTQAAQGGAVWVNLPKFALTLTMILCGFVLVLVNKLDAAVWIGYTLPLGGIAVGNGISAVRGQTITPIIGRRPVPPAADGSEAA